MKFIAGIIFAIITVSTMPRAAEVSGADEPAFQTVLEQWLANEDEGPLRSLVKLAEAGNTAAQLMLAHAFGDGHRSRWFNGLAPKERQAFTRATRSGRPFGVSWLTVAAETSVFARILKDRFDRTDQEILDALYESGEQDIYFLWLQISSDEHGLERMIHAAMKGRLSPDQVVASWLAADFFVDDRFNKIPIPGAEQLLADAEHAFASGSLRGLTYGAFRGARQNKAYRDKWGMWFWGGDLMIDESATSLPTQKQIEPILMNAPQTASLRRTCAAFCPEEKAACVTGAFTSIGGYFKVIDMGTPLRSLINPTQYSGSQRALWEPVRLIANSMMTDAGRQLFWPVLENRSKCLARVVRHEMRTNK